MECSSVSLKTARLSQLSREGENRHNIASGARRYSAALQLVQCARLPALKDETKAIYTYTLDSSRMGRR
jgi:hypothetical protein